MPLQLKVISKQIAALAAGAAMLALTACDEAIVVAPGAIETSDSCARFQQEIVAAREAENNLRVENAALGAVVGGIAGAIVAGDDRRAEGAVIGALLGGVIGAETTAARQTQQRQVDADLLRDINAKAGSAQQLLTQAGRSAANLRNCRLGQVTALERSVRNGSVSVSTARSQLRSLQQRTNVDNQIISASFNGIGNRVDSFVNTGAQVHGVESAILTRQKAAQTSTAQQVRSATPNVPVALSTKSQVETTDARQQAQIESELKGIEVLLG